MKENINWDIILSSVTIKKQSGKVFLKREYLAKLRTIALFDARSQYMPYTVNDILIRQILRCSR